MSEYSSVLASGEENSGDESFGGYDGDEAFNDSMWDRFGSGQTENDIFGDSDLDIIGSIAKMYTYSILGAEALTVITILIIIGVLSSREKKK